MLLELQDRLKALLEAEPYFAGVTIITERKGDILSEIERELGKLQFSVVVATAEGEAQEGGEGPRPVWDLRLNVSLIQAVRLDEQAESRNVIQGLEAAMGALQNQPVNELGRGPGRLAVTRFEAIPDENVTIYQLTVACIGQLN